jgi:hypothetical protein
MLLGFLPFFFIGFFKLQTTFRFWNKVAVNALLETLMKHKLLFLSPPDLPLSTKPNPAKAF